MKLFRLTNLRRPLSLLVVVIFGLLVLALPGVARADDVAQGFDENGSLSPGWIVALSTKSSTTVEAVPANNPGRIYGVVINPSEVPFTLKGSGQQVFVATNGTYPVLVSAVYGTIQPGDYISMSNTDGIGAKAANNQAKVLGTAVDGFDGRHDVLTGSGQTAVGKIMVKIQPIKNPLLKSPLNIPGPLARVASAIAGRNVSAARVWAALAVFLTAAGIALILLIVGVRTGLISIGRNPLSKHAIVLGLFQVVAVSILIFIVGLFGVYLLLKL